MPTKFLEDVPFELSFLGKKCVGGLAISNILSAICRRFHDHDPSMLDAILLLPFAIDKRTSCNSWNAQPVQVAG